MFRWSWTTRRLRPSPFRNGLRTYYGLALPGLDAAWGPQIDFHFRAFDGCQRLSSSFLFNLKAIPFPVIPLGERLFRRLSQTGELSAWIFLDDGKVYWFIAHRWRSRG